MSEQLLISSIHDKSPTNSSVIRPIHYLGSKLRLADAIRNAIDHVDPSKGRVCDLFAGSGTVASILSHSRPVTSVDIQEYSRVLCSAVLNPSALTTREINGVISNITSSEIMAKLLWCFEPLINYENECRDLALNGEPDPLAEILEKGSIATCIQMPSESRTKTYQKAAGITLKRLAASNLMESPESTTSRYFGGIYFSFEQSVILDALLCFAQNGRADTIDLITSAVLSTASQIVNTVGKQFAQPIRPKSKDGTIKKSFVAKVEKDRNSDTVSVFRSCLEKFSSIEVTQFKHRAITGNYLDVIKEIGSSLSCVYADPPYTRDHYSRYYHVLETMCRRDNPLISTIKKGGKTVASRGIYRLDRHQSPFCIRSEAPAAFLALFQQVHDLGIPLVLSYSPHENADRTHPRVVSIDQITDMAKKVFEHVEVEVLDGIAHSKLNSNIHKLPTRSNAELIIKCMMARV